MKIALYGGSFNPPHVGHLLAAQLVLATEDVDELWFVPTHTHMNGKQLLDYEHRIEMTRMMARYVGPRASVSRAEGRLAKTPGFRGSLTVDLIRAIKEEWPNDSFRFIIGTDLVQSAKEWEGWDEVVSLAPPIAVARSGYGTNPLAHRVVVPDVSSTFVKECWRAGRDVTGMVPREVLEYMDRNELYL